MVGEFQKALLLCKEGEHAVETLVDLFDDLFQVHTASVCPETLSDFDVMICTDTSWVNNASAVDVFMFVLNGGGLICIAGGTDMRRSHEMCNVIGARMKEHNAMTHLVFTPTYGNNTGSDQETFELVEMPYRYQFDPYTKREILLTYQYGKLAFPAMWWHSFGAGRVVCLTAGQCSHNLASFPLKRLLYRSALWVCGKADKPC